MQNVVDVLCELDRFVAQIAADRAARHQRRLGAPLQRASRWIALGGAQIEHQPVAVIAEQARCRLPGSPAVQRNIDIFELARGHAAPKKLFRRSGAVPAPTPFCPANSDNFVSRHNHAEHITPTKKAPADPSARARSFYSLLPTPPLPSTPHRRRRALHRRRHLRAHALELRLRLRVAGHRLPAAAQLIDLRPELRLLAAGIFVAQTSNFARKSSQTGTPILLSCAAAGNAASTAITTPSITVDVRMRAPP